MLSQLTHDTITPRLNKLLNQAVPIVIPRQYLFIRRVIEMFVVIVISPLIIAVGLIVALLVAIESKGGVLYIQQRPGKNGKLFKMIKFRTMYRHVSADHLTQENDLRVTQTGKWLRKYKLDEIPQLWNVLRGDMSIIGPRPIPYNFHKIYVQELPGYTLRNVIRPGITGLAQVVQGYTRTVDEERIKLSYDLHYINNISAKMDLNIIWRTIMKIIRGKQ